MKWYKFLPLSGSGLIIATVLLAGKLLPEVTGGSLSLVILFPAFVVGGRLYDMKKEVTCLSSLLFLLIGLNGVHFLIAQKTVPIDLIIILYNASVFAAVFIIVSPISASLCSLEDVKKTENTLTLRHNFLWKVYCYPLLGFVYSLLFSLSLPESYQKYALLEMVPICFLVVPVFLTILLVWIKRWGEYKLDFIIKKDGAERPEEQGAPRKSYIILMTVVGIMGTILEVSTRDNIVLWIETFSTLNIASLLLWKVRVHRYGTADHQGVPREKPLIAPFSVISTAIFHWVVGMLLSFILLRYGG